MRPQGFGATDTAILILPRLTGATDPQARARRQKMIEIMKIPAKRFKLLPPDAFRTDQPRLTTCPHEISVFLFLNNRSLLHDPINWIRLKSRLTTWRNLYCPDAVVTETLTQKFAERVSLDHFPRVFGKYTPATVPPPLGILGLVSVT